VTRYSYLLFIFIFGIWTQNFKGQGHLDLFCFDLVFSLTVLHFFTKPVNLIKFLFRFQLFRGNIYLLFETCTHILFVSACTLRIMS